MKEVKAAKVLSKYLPLTGSDTDHCTSFNDKAVTDIDFLIHAFRNEFGNIVLNGLDSKTKEIAVVFIKVDETGTTFSTACPSKLSCKLMKAAYAFI